MIIGLTGTPGCGKTTVTKLISEGGVCVIHLTDFLRERGLLLEYDEETESFEVDPKDLEALVQHLLVSEKAILFEGHLSHFISCDIIIVLRCHPDKIRDRLEQRGYSEEKINENLEAEALDVILIESIETGRQVFEIDCSQLTPEQVHDVILEIMEGEEDKYAPGNVDWSEELLKWC